MKKIGSKLFPLFICLICVSSCVTTNKGFQSAPVISREVLIDPIFADIEVFEDNKLKGESTSNYVLGFRIKGDNTYADGVYYSNDAFANYPTVKRINNNYVEIVNKKRTKRKRIAQVSSSASYEAMKDGDYDFLIHPNYTIKIDNFVFYKKIIVEVTGYGAKYKNFRTEKPPVPGCCD